MSELFQDIVPEKDLPSTSGERLVIAYNTSQVQVGVNQPIYENSQIAKDIIVDQNQETIEHHDP